MTALARLRRTPLRREEVVALDDPRVEELAASRRRLVLAGDADRRRIERELHDGPQQQLVALAVKVQHARRLVDTDPGAAGALLDEMRREVGEALDALRSLAQRLHPPLLEAGGLRTALRSAAAVAGVPTRVQVTATEYPPEATETVYRCCVEALDNVGDGGTAEITVRQEKGMLVFAIAADGADVVSPGCLTSMRDRVEALGGRLSIESTAAQGVRISGSLPVSG